MFCIKCGTKLSDDSKFCIICGEKIQNVNKNESKICPFCKKQIPKNSASCPECSRTLVENIEIKEQVTTNHKQTSRRPPVIKKRLNLKPLIVIIILLVVGYLVISDDSSSNNNLASSVPPLKINQPPTQVIGNSLKVAIDPLGENFSLSNNTVIDSSSYYLHGNGELKIENGTNYDAVAKLVKPSVGKSVYTVYIKANSGLTIKNITDGLYELYFAHGQDWDLVNEEFNYNKSYSKFEDSFNFTTKETRKHDGVYENYTIFEVTLHGVIGGTAETDNVSEIEFSNF
jgi:hypothetical protein